MANTPFSSSHDTTPSSEDISRTPESPKTHEEEHKRSFLGEILHFSLIALAIVLPIRMFVAQPFIVSGASMETTFSTGQYLIVDQLSYHFNAPERGDVIVFRYPKDPSKYFIKRIIALPGDTIQIDGRSVTISNSEHREHTLLTEPYVLDMSPNTTLTETLGEREYFVMGDNRDQSSDSRMWGVLPRENIIGRAFLRLFPFSVFGVMPGNFDLDAEIIGTTSPEGS